MCFRAGSRRRWMNFAITHFMPRSYIRISDPVVFGIPRSAASSCTVSHWYLLITAPLHIQNSQVFFLLYAFQNMDHFQQTLDHLWNVSHFYFCCTYCIIPESLLNHLNSFCGRMFKLNTKFDADLLLCSLNHFECDGHTVHMLPQWHPPLTLTSTVKSFIAHTCTFQSAFLDCQLTCPYISNGWTFSEQTSLYS